MLRVESSIHMATSSITRIRAATAADAARVVEMSARFLETTRYGTIVTATREQLAQLTGLVLAHGVILVAEIERSWSSPHDPSGFVWACDQTLVGMLAMVALPHPLTGEPFADELAWYVEPEHRRGTVGPRLLAAGEAWARAQGFSVVKMVAPAGGDVGRFYARRGYVEVETVWQKTFTDTERMRSSDASASPDPVK